jgi:integrase/recombinase XerD
MPISARIISGLKSFSYLILKIIEDTGIIETPKTGRKLPDTLSVIEIDALIDAIDLSTKEGGAMPCLKLFMVAD